MYKYFTYNNKTREDFHEDVIRALIERRKELALTQEQLDYILGVSDRQVSKWECGTRVPKPFHLYCWSDALNGRLAFIPNEYDLVKSNGLIRLVRFKKANDNLK